LPSRTGRCAARARRRSGRRGGRFSNQDNAGTVLSQHTAPRRAGKPRLWWKPRRPCRGAGCSRSGSGPSAPVLLPLQH